MKTADYYIHGRGRGHASRSPVVLSELSKAGYETRIHAGGDALDLLPEQHIYPRPPLNRGAFAPLRLGARASADAIDLWRRKPNVVLSDGDHGAILAGRLTQTPVIALGHDLVFDSRVRLPALPRGPLNVQRVNAIPTRAADYFIAVHFLPAVSDHPRVKVARPEGVAGDVPPYDPHAPLVCYFRDGNGRALARSLARAGRTVQLFGPGAQSEPGIDARPFSREGFRECLRHCAGVVGSAGSNMLAECVLLAKPVLAVYRDGDAEQCLNATLVEHAGVGLGRPLDQGVRATDEFMRRVSSRDFTCVDLAQALPPLSLAVRQTLAGI